jgi:hypothetical protein
MLAEPDSPLQSTFKGRDVQVKSSTAWIRSTDKLSEPTSNVASPQDGLTTNRGGCPQLELLEVLAHLEACDQEADPALRFRLCWRQIRYRDKIAMQGLAGPREKKKRQKSARVGAVRDLCGPAAVSRVGRHKRRAGKQYSAGSTPG